MGCGLSEEMNEDQLHFIDLMIPMNIEARYPSYKEALSRGLTPDYCRSIIDRTKEMQSWIKSKQALSLVRQYKQTISGMFDTSKVYMFGSYSKGYANPESDIDVAIVIPELKEDWFTVVPKLWRATRSVSTLIEPVLLEECHPSPLYDDVMKTGIAV